MNIIPEIQDVIHSYEDDSKRFMGPRNPKRWCLLMHNTLVMALNELNKQEEKEV